MLKKKKLLKRIETEIANLDKPSFSDDIFSSGAISSRAPVFTTSSSGATSATVGMSPVPTTSSDMNIRDTIHDAAIALQNFYQKGVSLTSSQLETMSCGLSYILDTGSDKVNGSQQTLFSDDH